MRQSPLYTPYSVKEEWKLVDTFDSTFWSGKNSRVYANDILLDESVQLNFNIFERLVPYYSYSRHVADRIYHGNRLISGELTLNFKRDSFIYSLINILRSNSSEDLFKPVNPVGDKFGAVDDLRISPPKHSTLDGRNLAEALQSGTLSPEQVSMAVKLLKKEKTEQEVNSFVPDIFDNIGLFETNIPGFDLNIIFGADIRQSLILKYRQNTYLPASNPDSITSAPSINPITGIKLSGVSILGASRAIGDDGRPILETYAFQARNLRVLDASDIIGVGEPVSDKEIEAPDTKITVRKK